MSGGTGLRHRSSSFLKPSTPKHNSEPLPHRPLRSQRSFDNHYRQAHPVSAKDLIAITTTTARHDLPLSTMYANAILRARTPSLSNSLSSAASDASPETVTAEFRRRSPVRRPVKPDASPLDAYRPSLAPQPLAIPSPAITKFVRSCFSTHLCEVDFTQALKAMDYLNILDARRKREFSFALRRLNIDTATFDFERSDLEKNQPAIYDWIISMEDKARRIEALYTQVYIGLRRWTLINEMRLLPFNKNNCCAMLDTLYPSSYSQPPTAQLTEIILNSQRQAFLRYIEAVEKNGRSVLMNLEHQSRRPGEHNGWPVVREIVDKYLRMTNDFLDTCIATKGPESFEDIEPLHHNRVDSGISVASSSSAIRDRKSASPAFGAPQPTSRLPPTRSQTIPIPTDKALPPQPHQQPQRKGSAFGRFAKELRRFKSRSADGRGEDVVGETIAGRRSDSHNRSGSSMGRASATVPRDISVPSQSTPQSRENSAERTIGLGIIDIDDNYRERLIREAREARQAKGARKNPEATHFKLEEERNGHGLAKPVVEFVAEPLEERVSYRTRPMPWDVRHPALNNPYQAPPESLVIAELP